MKSRLFAVARAVLIALTVLTGAIAAPILCRQFFYLHIEPLNLTDAVGLTVEQIKTAYTQMLAFCVGVTDAFSAGVLPFSESGADHFADVRKLFVLDLAVFAAAFTALLALRLFGRGRIRKLAGHTAGFWAAVGLGATFLTVGGLAATDFNRAFVVFHKIFFPGKDNWLFDSRTDPIINMLPAEFFRNCAILILALILISCALLIGYDRMQRRKR